MTVHRSNSRLPTIAMLQQFVVAALLILSVTSPLPCSGLLCDCTQDCSEQTSTCETAPGGVCYAQYFSDVSGKHWTLHKAGCQNDPSSVICHHNATQQTRSACCNDKDMCNVNLINTTSDPSTLLCNCNGNSKCDEQDQCTLRESTKYSCYTVIRRLGSTIAYQRGCVKKCTDYHNENEIRTCCRGNKCNNESIPSTWPTVSPTSTTSTVTPSYTPPSLIEGTTATPPPPTSDSTTPDIFNFEHLVTPDPEHPKQLVCNCSSCMNGEKTCLAAVACASFVIESTKMTWCVQDEFTCKNGNGAFQLNCCYSDYCNDPVEPNPGLPCDDEDTEASGSGGCHIGTLTTCTFG